MKLVIASDIHGSKKYLDILVEKYKRSKADKLVLLGDLYYHGPRNPLPEGYDPQGCFTLLNTLKNELLVIQGNCDAEVDQMVSEFNIVKTAEILDSGKTITLVHGHDIGPLNIPHNVGDALVYGHFHVTKATKDSNGLALISPGSISLPKEDTKRAYIVYEDKVFTIYDLIDDSFIASIEI